MITFLEMINSSNKIGQLSQCVYGYLQLDRHNWGTLH